MPNPLSDVCPSLHVPSSVIFREYDIRGCAHSHLTPNVAYHIAQAFGDYLRLQWDVSAHGVPEVCLAHDGRLTSPLLAQAFCDGLREQGVNVVFLGLGPTPFLYWAEHALNTVAGVMITGSHNPPQDNGIKLTFQKQPFFGPQIQALYQRIQHPFTPQKRGNLIQKNLCLTYAESLTVFDAPPQKTLKIIWDPGNGATGAVLRHALQKLPHHALILNETVDGTFPNRSPDPTKVNALQPLQETIRQEGADLGFAFDGDGDRLVVVDRSGHIWMGDELLVFMAEHLHTDDTPLTVVADIKSSPFLLERLKERGIPVSVAKTGHVHIKKAMREKSATLGGEVSGHFFFRDHHWGFDDGLYTALRLIDMVSKNASLLAWRDTLPQRFSSPEVRLRCPEEIKIPLLTAIKKDLTRLQIPFQTLDGILVSQEKGWWLIRPSQTESVVVVRWEALTQDAFETIRQYLQTYLTPWQLSL